MTVSSMAQTGRQMYTFLVWFWTQCREFKAKSKEKVGMKCFGLQSHKPFRATVHLELQNLVLNVLRFVVSVNQIFKAVVSYQHLEKNKQ